MRILGGFVVLSAVASAQSREIVQASGTTGSAFGRSAVMVGDLDGDGRADLLVGAFLDGGIGSATIRSGADGSELRRHDGEQSGAGFGVVEELDDVNGDGLFDYVVSAPDFLDAGSAKTTGKLYVYSGADGALLWSLVGFGDRKQWGTQLASVGDVDGDGATDFVVNKVAGGGVQAGRLELLSGASGASLWIVDATAQAALGSLVTRVRDVDGDGIAEIAATSPLQMSPNAYGRVTLFSGASGAELWHMDGGHDDTFAAWLAAAGDVDADGIEDIAVGAPERGGANEGAIQFFSGIDGHPLGEIDGEGAGDFLGYRFSNGFDADGDGDPDMGVVRPDGLSNFRLSLYDTRTFTRIAEVSLANGGQAAYSTLASAGDLDGDGFGDLLVGMPAQNSTGMAFVYALRSPPALASVTPPRGDHKGDVAVTITGSGFLLANSLQVNFGAASAGNVAVVDDTTIACTALADVPGPVDVTVTTDAGSATLANDFARTPATVLEGDDFLGGTLTERSLCDPGDTLLGLVGFAPEVAIPLPPFEGSLCISPFVILFLEPGFATDEKDLVATLPNDPGLSGVELLFQSLIGPQLSGHPKVGCWTNCAHLRIR